MKNKTKLKFISEYIFLRKTEDYCKNLTSDCDFIKERTKKLLKIYKKIFFKYGFFDLSFAILQKELKSDSFGIFADIDLSKKISEIENEIKIFLSKSRLNEFEKNYIVE